MAPKDLAGGMPISGNPATTNIVTNGKPAGMELESQLTNQSKTICSPRTNTIKHALLVINYTLFLVCGAASPLLLRLYYIHGGRRKWFSSWIQTGGWPCFLIPLSVSYLHRRRGSGRPAAKVCLMGWRLFVSCIALGQANGLNAFLFAYGVSYLPASTSSILGSTQLGFTALFAFLIVRHRFTPYSILAVALLTSGTLALALKSNGDRPEGESRAQYFIGFFMTLAGALVSGAVLPVVELMYGRTKRKMSYTLVLETQMVMSLSATVFSTVGMLVNKDFKAIPKEAMEVGELKYYELFVWTAIIWQLFYLSIVGTIFFASALLAGILQSLLVPITEVLAVIFFHESFNGAKGAALVLSVCGFAIYFYGDYKRKNQPVGSSAIK